MTSLGMLGAVVGNDAGESSPAHAVPAPKAPLRDDTDRPALDLRGQDAPTQDTLPPKAGAERSEQVGVVGAGSLNGGDAGGQAQGAEESDWTKVSPPMSAAGPAPSHVPSPSTTNDATATTTSDRVHNPNDNPQQSAPPDPNLADPVTNPPTHYNRLEPFPEPHKEQAAATHDPRAVDSPLNTATSPTGSPWNRLSTTAGAAGPLNPQISTPPASELREEPSLGASARPVPRLTPPAPPPKDALAPLVAPEFKDEMGNVKDHPADRDDRPSEHVPPAEVKAKVPDHLDGLAEAGTVTMTAEVSQKTAHDPGIVDLGWNEHPDDIPSPVIGGVTNDTLWMLIRRFDKQMYHVKAVPDEKIVGPLDLQVAEEEEFSPDKLRANLERFYVSVIISTMAFVKHIMRLRSWNEPRRTGIWLAVYVVAWWTDMILPTIFTLILVLILFPPARTALFPPAPLALVSTKTGNLQTPRAGTLATDDTLTGAPENHQGEAAEQEATNFVNGFASLAVGTALGKHPDGDAVEGKHPSNQAIDKTLPDPSNLGTTALDAKQTAGGDGQERDKDKTKQPMEVAIWTKARPAMRALTAVADTWEMLANALSPTPPFNHLPRYKLAGVVAPIIILTALLNNEMLNKGIGAGVGFGFFGQPLIDRGLNYLNTHYPDWQKALDLRNSLLVGVPTNAQLTLTLLRIGEANKQPLPPPPVTKEAPPSRPSSPVVKHEDLPSDLQNAEVERNVPPEEAPDVAHGKGVKTEKKHKVMSKIGGLLKGATKTGVSGVMGADHVKASLGSEHAKQRLGIIPPSGGDDLVDGPSVFEARVHGKKGHVIISTTATTPCVSWIPAGSKRSKETGDWQAEFSILLSDIQEMRKVGGLGWKGKLVVGWAYEREVYDGLEIVDSKGKTYTFTAMKRRDELFNRLIALVKHKWEAW